MKNLNISADRSPKMVIHQAMWSMESYGSHHKEWSMEEKFEKIAEAGFDGIYSRLPEPSEEKQWRRLIDRYNFSFGLESFPNNREDLRALLERAKDFEYGNLMCSMGNRRWSYPPSSKVFVNTTLVV